MSNSQQFDNYVKEHFSDYAPDVHPRIWENIAARKERKKPAGFWISLFDNKKGRLLVAALFLAVSSGTAWWFYTNNEPSVSSTQQSDNKEKNTTTGNQQNNTAGDNDPATGSSNNGQPTAIEQSTPTGKVNNTASATGENVVGNNTSQQKTSVSSGRKNKIPVHSSSINVQNGEQEEGSTGTNVASSRKKQTAGKNLLRIRTTTPGAEESGEGEDEPAVGGSLLGRLTFDAEMISAKRKAKNLLPLSFQQINFLPDCPSIEKNASGNKKYFEFYAGPDYAFRSLSDTGNSEYLRKRKESTKFSSGFSAGVRYTRVFNNSMSVRAGFNYSQINEKFTFSQGNVVQVTYIIGSNEDTLGSYTTVGTRYKSSMNRYRTIDIPIAMGYEVGNGKWHANINAGVIVNLYSWQKGDVLDTASNPVNITTGKNSSPYQFKTNAGVGFIGAVSVYYKLNDRLHLMAEPYFRYSLSPMNKENITLKQKYQTAGIRLGIRLDLP